MASLFNPTIQHAFDFRGKRDNRIIPESPSHEGDFLIKFNTWQRMVEN